MNRRIVLVALPVTRHKDPQVPLGHGSLLASLAREATLDVRSVVQAVNHGDVSAAETTNTILDHAAGVPHTSVDVAIGAYIWNEKFLGELLRLLRSRGFQGRIILGGPQVSYAGPGLEQFYPAADAFIRGPAEDALRALALDCGRPRIPGVHYAGEVDQREQAVTTFETLPSPWLSGASPIRGLSFVRWETQRGCLFHCSFCQHRQPDARTPCATLPEGRIRQEIDLFCRAGINRIAVLDPLFNSNKSQAESVLRWFAKRGYRGELSLQCRAEFVDDGFLDAAQALDVCLEFGLQSIHKREYLAVGRPNNMEKASAVLANVRRRKIKHEVSLIFGLPEQTLDSFQNSVRWCLEQGVPTIKAFPLLLLRGTLLEQQREQWGLVVKDGELPMVVESKTFTRCDWENMARLADALCRTEGHHPVQIENLLQKANGSASDLESWCELAVGRGV